MSSDGDIGGSGGRLIVMVVVAVFVPLIVVVAVMITVMVLMALVVLFVARRLDVYIAPTLPHQAAGDHPRQNHEQDEPLHVGKVAPMRARTHRIAQRTAPAIWLAAVTQGARATGAARALRVHMHICSFFDATTVHVVSIIGMFLKNLQAA